EATATSNELGLAVEMGLLTGAAPVLGKHLGHCENSFLLGHTTFSDVVGLGKRGASHSLTSNERTPSGPDDSVRPPRLRRLSVYPGFEGHAYRFRLGVTAHARPLHKSDSPAMLVCAILQAYITASGLVAFRSERHFLTVFSAYWNLLQNVQNGCILRNVSYSSVAHRWSQGAGAHNYVRDRTVFTTYVTEGNVRLSDDARGEPNGPWVVALVDWDQEGEWLADHPEHLASIPSVRSSIHIALPIPPNLY
ncbi:hypothetical protein BV25DRAFT_1820733, partial [Artomyces pyxidatus]